MKLTKLPAKLVQYLKEVKIEAKKINWPTRKEAIRYTLIVLGISLVIGIFLGVVDLIFIFILNKFLLK